MEKTSLSCFTGHCCHCTVSGVAFQRNPQFNEKSFVMYDNMMHDGGMNGWMHEWMNRGMWVWPVISALAVALLIFVVIKLLKK